MHHAEDVDQQLGGPSETSISERCSSCSTRIHRADLDTQGPGSRSNVALPALDRLRPRPARLAPAAPGLAAPLGWLGRSPAGPGGSPAHHHHQRKFRVRLGSDGLGCRSDGGCNPASSTRTPLWLPHQRHDQPGSAGGSHARRANLVVASIITLPFRSTVGLRAPAETSAVARKTLQVMSG